MKIQRIYFHRVGSAGQEDTLDIPLGDDPKRHVADALIHRVLIEDARVGEIITHELKCWPTVFDATESGKKTAEFRLSDRPYAVNDILLLREWDPATLDYTGRSLQRRITHILANQAFGLPPGFVMLSMAPAEEPSP